MIGYSTIAQLGEAIRLWLIQQSLNSARLFDDRLFNNRSNP